MKYFFMFILLSIFMINFASAIDFDNTMKYEKQSETITFENRWGLEFLGGGTVAEAKLTRNLCGQGKFGYRKCVAKKTITLYEDSELIQDFKTLRVDDGSNNNEDIEDYKFEYYDGEYWVEFVEGQKFHAGTYDVITYGTIDSSKVYDWQVKINGDWTTPWAIWGNISEGDEAEVILNSPADNFLSLVPLVTFNASGNVTGGPTLTNGSLYTNESGVWEAKNITNITGIVNTTADHGFNLNNADGSFTYKYGMIVNFTSNVTIFNVTKASSATATSIHIQSSYGGPDIALATFVGSVATFSTPVQLNPDTNYWILADSGGASHNGYNQPSGVTLPIADGILTWAFAEANAGLETNNIKAIELIGYSFDGSTSFSTETWNRTITQDSVLWNVEFCDTDGDCGFATQNRTLLRDVTSPIITVQSPSGILNSSFVGNNETLNVTFNDSGLDTCWFNYNGTNTTIDGCLNGIKNSTNFLMESNNFNMTLYANDTQGNENSTFISWSYFTFINSQTFSSNTTEGSTESFSINYVANETPTSVNFIYNGTITSADIDSSNFPIIIVTESIVIPNVDSQTNFSFFWNIVSSSSNLNTSSTNQTVNVLSLDNCSSFSNVLFNYTMVDESSQAVLNGSSQNVSVEVDISMFDSSKDLSILNFSTQFNGTNPNAICSATNIFNGTTFVMDSTVKYSSSGRAIEYYNIRDQTIDNNSVTQNITLFDIKTSESTDFQITFKNSDFVIVEGALIQVNRQYVSEGVFKTVELPITDSNGQAVVHLVKNDVVYNYIVTKENEVIGLFNNLVAFCDDETIGQCFILLNAIQGVTPAFNPDEGAGISFLPLSFNTTTRDLDFTFTTNDGTVRTVQMSAIKMDQIGNTSVCDTSITSSSGTLTCNVPESIGNETIIVTVTVDGQIAFTSYFSAANDIELGEAGFFLLLFMVLSLAMMFSESKAMTIVGIMIGFIAGSLLFFIQGGIIAGGTAIIWLIIMGIILIWKLNKDGQT